MHASELGPPGGVITHRFVDSPGALEATRVMLLGRLAPFALPKRCLYRLQIVLEEWLTNVAMHGHDASRAAVVDITIRVGDDLLLMVFADEGRSFDPTLQPEQDPKEVLATRRIGGLGLAMMRRASRQISYRQEGGRNMLSVVVARE